MSKYVKGILAERIKRTAEVESFRFTPAEKSVFLPGQFLKVFFDQGNLNNKELNKYLSFSCSPWRDYIEVTKRLSESRFSMSLKNLKAGDEVLFQLPMGSCVFGDNLKKAAFLIGGIGITPVISILEYVNDKKLDTDIVLFYSNRTEEDIAFRRELDSWQAKNPNLKVFYTVTSCAPRDSRCLSGVINKELILEKASDWKQRIFFIFGPPVMVKAMRDLCLGFGCSKEDIKAENFLGY